MRTVRTTRILSALLVGLVSANPLIAQVVTGHTLTGDWVRVVSNNNPNDRMRIAISGAGGVLTQVPGPARPHWKIGQTLWQGIQTNGSLQVLGSDGNYYQATMTLNGPDELKLAIQLRTAGDDQTWRRAGPNIAGDWVRVAPPGTPGDGTRIQVQGVAASVRYLTATAPRVLRVGSRIWQGIGASGGLAALGSDRKYHPSTWSLIAPDRLQVNAPALAGGPGQIWVRPAAVASARGAVRTPPANPSAPGSGLTPPTNLPGLPTTPSTPPVPASAAPPCFVTSMPHDQTGLDWGLTIHMATRNSPIEETLGLRDYMNGALGPTGGGARAPAETERVRLPGLQDGYAYVWERRPSQPNWTKDTDLTAAFLSQKIQSSRSAGRRPTDIEGFLSSSATYYAAVWETNAEGLDWKLDYDLTAQQYSTAYQSHRANGYRLVDMEAYETAAGPRYAAVWWSSCDNTNWKHEFDLDRTTYQARVNAEAQLGFRVIDFESYETPSGQQYAAIWQRMQNGRAWNVRTDRSLQWFLNYHREYVDEGMRLVDFESYDTANGVRFAGVWAENDARYSYPFKTALDAIIQKYRTDHVIPGISVVVMQDDTVMYRRGFGWADSAQQKTANSETVYIMASIAKAIGGTVAARLEERGVLDLGDPTRSLLPGMPNYHTHTVEQLLAKTGCARHYPQTTSRGLPDFTRTYRWQKDAAQSMWQDSLLTNPACVPGSQYHYSTHGYTFVGAVLEEVTGKPIGDLISDELAQPFGLPSLGLLRTLVWGGSGGGGVRPFHLAQAYRRVDTLTNWTRRVAVPYENSTWKVLGGGLQANALDLARFAWLTLDGQIVTPATRDNRLWKPLTSGTLQWSDGSRPPVTALGWEVLGKGPRIVMSGGSQARSVAQHQGNALGATSLLRTYRNDGLTIAILTNQKETLGFRTGNHPVDRLATSIATAVMQNPPP